jgi:hypothetical protein
VEDQGTKRSLTSIASKLFDPFGFLSPYTIRAKILFQELWSKGIQWDGPLDEEIVVEWQKWKDELGILKDVKVPRFFYEEQGQIIETELHGFSDASPNAYGAAVYLRSRDDKNNIKTHIVMAKSKVAPT